MWIPKLSCYSTWMPCTGALTTQLMNDKQYQLQLVAATNTHLSLLAYILQIYVILY